MNNRSQRWNAPPLIDAAITMASYNSCFRVNTSTIAGPYVFGLDHGFEKIQNAVLLVQDQLNGLTGQNSISELDNYYAADWEVRIGNSPIYSGNPLCPGGPSLKTDYKDYYNEFAFQKFS